MRVRVCACARVRGERSACRLRMSGVARVGRPRRRGGVACVGENVKEWKGFGRKDEVAGVCHVSL